MVKYKTLQLYGEQINNSMEFDPSYTFKTESLSALAPVEFTYNFNRDESLAKTFRSYTNGFSYYAHNAFADVKDATFSRKTLLVLTDKKSLYDVFDPDSETLNLGTVAGTIFLKNNLNQYVTSLKGTVYVGGSTPLMIAVSPLETSSNIVELIIDKSRKIIIDKEYPFTARVSNDNLVEEELYRQRFEVDYSNDKICFKTQTISGPRYLAYTSDQTMRATGLMLNEVVASPYIFSMEYVSDKGLLYNFNAKTSEVTYYNELPTYLNRNTVTVKNETISDTHLLISCSTSIVGKHQEKIPVNISLTKTNFAANGTYLNKPNL